MYIAMLQYGTLGIDEISPCDGTSIDGIRLTFHEHEIEPSVVLGKQLMEMRYNFLVIV